MHSLLLPTLFLCSSLLFLTASATANDGVNFTRCPSDTNYTRGSAFQANLVALLSSLPAAAAASSGFAKLFTGVAPDQAYGLGQCVPYVNSSECLACLDGLARDMAASSDCSGQKEAFFFYDACLLRHSNASFFGVDDASEAFHTYSPDETLSETEQFTSQLGALMANLSQKAAHGSPRMFAAGSVVVTPLMRIYGMAQCTRDLPADDCSRCLTKAVTFIPNCCAGRQGGRVVCWSCSIRFEVYSFYDVQAAEAPMATATHPGPGGGSVNVSDHSSSKESKHRIRTVLLVSIPVAVISMVLLLVAVYLSKRKRKAYEHVQTASAEDGNVEEMRSSESLMYDLSTLRAATNNFSEENKLGEGGFGIVYKGTLQNGQQIAVKRLSATSQQGHAEMRNEIVLVAKLQHKNLVRLIGCCIEERERILIYELLSNSSLDKILFDPAHQEELSWGQRFKIIEGVGRGLLYLHEDSRLTVIHRDLKASNVLLDADMNPKISDFGLAKLFNIDSASMRGTNRIAGTFGYMAPEYAMRGIFSAKSDVYSFGVLVLEIVTGRRPSENLLDFVWRHWSRGSVLHLLEGCRVHGPGAGPQETLRCIHVGLLCVQDDPNLRPSMASVVVMLNSHSITLPAPAEPAFVMMMMIAGEEQTAAPEEPSINEGSVSDLQPR